MNAMKKININTSGLGNALKRCLTKFKRNYQENPWLTKLDFYIIRKFLGTFIFSIVLIIAITRNKTRVIININRQIFALPFLIKLMIIRI